MHLTFIIINLVLGILAYAAVDYYNRPSNLKRYQYSLTRTVLTNLGWVIFWPMYVFAYFLDKNRKKRIREHNEKILKG